MTKKKILFMCVANSARSQMAEGLARAMFPGAEIESAGSQPGHLNPSAVQVMQEIGIDISQHYSKSCEQLPGKFFTELDYVITLCAEEVCPMITTRAQKLHWSFPDPAGNDPELFRKVRDGIQQLLRELALDIQ